MKAYSKNGVPEFIAELMDDSSVDEVKNITNATEFKDMMRGLAYEVAFTPEENMQFTHAKVTKKDADSIQVQFYKEDGDTSDDGKALPCQSLYVSSKALKLLSSRNEAHKHFNDMTIRLLAQFSFDAYILLEENIDIL